MFTKIKTTAGLLIVMTLFVGCAAQQNSSSMNMGSSMCKKMMEQGKCGCCQDMGDMSKSGMMSGGQPMQCMSQSEKNPEMSVANETKTPDAAEHKAHHPERAQ